MPVNTKQKPERIIYLASTHWDREWYHPFQVFRFRLVEVIDEILSVLENNPEFTRFTLDGQSILLDDYLEIKPENRTRIEKLLKEGRLVAGPWYTMPDEELCSGESLINNLRLGFETVRGFGVEPMKLGYMCDMFGHIAQMPQILNGFGIEGALLGRGTNQDKTEAFFTWQSPDGSRCATFKVPEESGYGNFYNRVIEPYQHGSDSSRENMLGRAVQFVQSELARSPLPYVILTDGMDHERIHSEAIWLAENLGKHFGCPVEILSPDCLLPELLTRLDELQILEGELRETAKAMAEHNKLIPHTLSSRYDVKLANDRCQDMLERVVGPMSALASLEGKPVPRGYFTLMHRLMAQNQTHDSICGCSVDDVSRDMLYRYRQVEGICGEIKYSCFAALNDLSDDSSIPKTEKQDEPLPFGIIDIEGRVACAKRLKLTLFNSEPENFSGVIRTYIDFPEGYSARYGEYLAYEPRNMFQIFNASGNEVQYQLLSIEDGLFVNRTGKNYRERYDRYHVAVHADIPAMGSSELIVCPSSTPVRNMGSMRTGDLCAENEHLKITVNPSGTVDLLQKSTGRVFKNLLRFRIDAECGDGWFHTQPVGSPSVYSDGAGTKIELLKDGSECCAFGITKYMHVPVNLANVNFCRDSEDAIIEITSHVQLTHGSRMVEIQTTVHNTAKNYRLRLLLETGIQSDSYEADQAFSIVSRKAGVPVETASWKEADHGDSAFKNVIMRRDSNGGLALISAGGMHECAVRDDENGSVEITLLRSFGATFLTNGEPDGQLPGEWRFDCALLPLEPEDTNGFILKSVNRMRSGICAYTSAVPENYSPKAGTSMFRLKSKNVTLSSLFPSRKEGFICLRLVNYSNEPELAVMNCGRPIAEAFRTNLMEEEQEPVDYSASQLYASLSGHQVATFLLRLQ